MKASPKAVMFWAALAAACVCGAFAWGPAVGCWLFLGLGAAIFLLG